MPDACVYVGGGADVDSKASSSILFRNVKIEPAREGPEIELRPDVAVRVGYSHGLRKSG